MGLTLTNFDAILKDKYLGPIREQLNRSSAFYNKISNATNVRFDGRRGIVPLSVSGNTGVGSRASGGTLPTAGNQGTVDAIFPIKYHFGRIQLDDATISQSKNDIGAFIPALRNEMEGLTKDMKSMLGRQVFNDGYGTIARANGAGAPSTSLVFDGAKYRKPFVVGQVIDVWADSTFATKEVNSATITAVSYNADEVSGTLTIASSSWSDNAYIVFEDQVTATATFHEMQGLDAMVGGDGTYGLTSYLGVSGSTYPVWRSSIIDGSGINGGDPTDEMFQEGVDLVDRVSGEMSVDVIVTTHGVRKLYLSSLESDKRYMDSNLTGGWSAVSFQSGSRPIPVFVDRYCSKGVAYGVTMADFQRAVLEDFNWMDKDGAILSRVSNTAAYEATLKAYMEFVAQRRNSHFRIHSINES